MNAEAKILKAKDAPDLGSFDWADPFRLSEQLSEDERMIQSSAAAYAQEKLAPRVTKAFADETSDPEIFREMGEMGLLGVTLPEEYGGLGGSYVSYGLVAREIEPRLDVVELPEPEQQLHRAPDRLGGDDRALLLLDEVGQLPRWRPPRRVHGDGPDHAARVLRRIHHVHGPRGSREQGQEHEDGEQRAHQSKSNSSFTSRPMLP